MLYAPPVFRWSDADDIRAALQTARLSSLITQDTEVPWITHLPLLPDGDNALIGHFSKGNPHWKAISPGMKGVAVFLGPEAYVSPNYYVSKKVDQKAVPTWNYVAIHVTGSLELFDDTDRLLDVVAKLTNHFEAGQLQPWRVTDAPDDYLRGQLKGIVGLRLAIEMIEGKRKLSQNKNAADYAGVVEGLDSSVDPRDQAVAKIMRERKD